MVIHIKEEELDKRKIMLIEISKHNLITQRICY